MNLHCQYRAELRSSAWILLGLGVALILAWLSPSLPAAKGMASYVPLHTLLEVLAVVLSALIFGTCWAGYVRDRAGNLTLLGCIFLGVAALDFLHTLSYKGMPDFVTPSGAEKAIDFWLAGRCLAVLGLLAAATLPWRPLRWTATRWWWLAGTLALVALAAWVTLVHPEWTPQTFVEGKGLTPFKVGFEYVLVALFISAAWLFLRKMRCPQPFNVTSLFAASCVMAMSEIFFTLYADVTDIFNLLGHIYKVIAEVFLYRGIFVDNVRWPLQQLSQANELLENQYKDRVRQFDIIERSLNEIYVFDEHTLRFSYVNDGALKNLGFTLGEMTRKTPLDLKPDYTESAFRQMVNPLVQGAQNVLEFQAHHLRKDGSLYPVEVHLQLVSHGDSRSFLAVVNDITERVQTESQLAEREKTYRSLFETVPEGVVYHDATGAIISANPAAERILGLSLEQMQGKKSVDPHWRSMHADGSPFPGEEHPAMIALKTGKPVLDVVMGVLNPQIKRTNWIKIKAIPLRDDASGEIVQVYAIFEDITQAKENEEAMRTSEARWKFALEGAGDGAWDWDILTGSTSFSKRYKEMLGYAEHEFDDNFTAWEEKVHPDDFQAVHSHLEDYLAGKKAAYSPEMRMRCKDGSWKWILARGKVIERDAKGRPLRMIGTHSDISERKKSEERLRSLSIVVEQSPLSIVITDLKATLVYVNPHFLEVTGFSRSEVIGGNPRMLQSGLTPGETYSDMWQTLARGNVWHGELCNKKKNGELYWEEVHIAPIRNEAGLVTHYAGIKLDITQSKAIKAELRRSNEELEARVLARTYELTVARKQAETASQAKSEFLANMSHEIRTPMNSIIGMTYLMQQADGLNTKQADYLYKIQLSAQNLLGIINDVLDISKVEAGKLEIENVDFPLEPLLDGLSCQLAGSAGAKGLRLTFQMDPGLSHPLRGDSLRLRQILTNLIGNAIKFTEQGEIDVCARMMEADINGRRVRFEIQDTGIGISQAEISNLFQPFHQADASTTRKYGGTGLGLAISKKLAEMMGGEIGVESEPGKGSTFWFELRLENANNTAAIAHETHHPDHDAIRGAAILVVEDNLMNQQVAKDLLARHGANVTIAGNGQEAIESLRKRPYDCVLMDVQMPVMNGLEATRKIRADPALAGARVIAMTANARHEDRLRCREAGMDDFITKPIVPNELYATLTKWLEPAAHRSEPGPETQTTDDETDILDLTALTDTWGDNTEMIKKYALLFTQSIHADMNEIEAALEADDLTRLSELGHRAKTSARSVGAKRLGELFETLEQFRNGGDIAQARIIVGQMRPLLETVSELVHARNELR